MSHVTFAVHRLLKKHALAMLGAVGATLFLCPAFAELAVHHVELAPRVLESRVPAITVQNRFLAPQAISAVDISADGKFITIGTMAFSHDANVWQFGPD